ncbi:MAG: NADP-dependent malic enzyme [Eubacteriaceae bacterium]|nr:NADP-dependent malic enzyme [Eubacteriaceae bacterium]
MDIFEKSLQLHKQLGGKIATEMKISANNADELSLVYSPGVAGPCLKIHENKEDVYKYTIKANTVAIITDGSAVLGLGNIGSYASLPVMEGKALLLKRFAGLNAFPICIDSQDTEEIINIVKNICASFGAINLEDISAPRCFEIESRLIEELDIPVFHDDQHGTAIITLAGLINSAKLLNKNLSDLKIVINGAGAGGISTANLLLYAGIKDIIICDSKGIISKNRKDLNESKKEIASLTNIRNIDGTLADAVIGRDVFIGLSKPKLLTKDMIKSMNENSVIFALANPEPEILPQDAYDAGAKIVATGRSDFANQVNNVLAYPGIFKGVLKYGIKKITPEMMKNAAFAIASCVKENELDYMRIIPNAFCDYVCDTVADSFLK